MTAPTVPTPLPVPADFPVTWQLPGDEHFFWFQDVMHFPMPLTPLTASLQLPAFSTGATRGLQHLMLPVVALRYVTQNHYVYGCSVPFMGTEAEVAARMEQMKHAVMGVMQDLMVRFRDEFIPRVVELADGMRDADHSGLGPRELAERVLGLREVYTELWDIHMQVNIPPMGAIAGLDELLTAVLGAEEAGRAHLMLQGFPNKSVETGQRLYEFATRAREDDAVAEVIRSAREPEEVVAGLEVSAAGREFLAAWKTFLAEYGWRTGGFDMADAPWIDDWTIPLMQLRAFVLSSSPEAPIHAQQRQAVERDRLVAEVEGKLPPDVLPVFRMLLPAAQTYIPLAEDHNFYIDQLAFTSGRVPINALGKALTEAGVIVEEPDVYFLEFGDIEEIARGDLSDRREVVVDRRASLARAKATIPPEAIGSALPPEAASDILVSKFFGLGQDLPSDARVIRGIASSAGTATGTVKVVRTLDEAGKLEPGDVMVCHMTMPAWTPLFGTVSAVVADSGGVLSHCSIVAREYGIPCVTATRVGTRLLKDGQTVTVDGARGIVQVK